MIDASEFPSEAFEFTELKEMEVSSNAKLLTSGGCVWNGDISEDIEGMPAWIGVAASVQEDIASLLLVLVSEGYDQRLKVRAMNSRKGCIRMVEEVKCGDEYKPCVTATVFRHTLSAVWKSLSAKCLLHKKYLCTIFAESVLHSWPTASAHALTLDKRTHALYYKCWHYLYFLLRSLLSGFKGPGIICNCIILISTTYETTLMNSL
jgi:hypothetical protein